MKTREEQQIVAQALTHARRLTDLLLYSDESLTAAQIHDLDCRLRAAIAIVDQEALPPLVRPAETTPPLSSPPQTGC